MKKFISAVSSLVIAATAMGGTFALTSNAATVKAPDKTIFEFRARENGKNLIEAKGGDTITVDVYVPQCSGMNTLAGCLCINQNKTLGQEGCEIANPQTGEVATKLPTARGNYGIKMSNADFSNPGCFDSGWCKQAGKNAGNLSIAANGGLVTFYTDSWNLLYLANQAVSRSAGSVNIDAYAPFVKAGGDSSANKKWYTNNNYEPVFTWDDSVEWAYDYTFFSFDLTLPAGIADGEYVVDFLDPKTGYVTAQTLFETDESKWEKANTQVLATDENGDSKTVDFATKPLTIKVGGGATTTTTTPGTTISTSTTTTTIDGISTTSTTSTSKSEVLDKDTIQYELVPQDDKLTFKDGKVYVNPEAEFAIDWIVKNDLGTSGLEYAVDLSAFSKAGGALDFWEDGVYAGQYQTNDTMVATTGRFELIMANGGEEEKLADGSVVGTFNLIAPKTAGEYTIKLWTEDAKNQTVPRDPAAPAWKSSLKEITIVVGDVITTSEGSVTTTSTTSTSISTTTSVSTTTISSEKSTTSTSTTTTSSSVSTDTTAPGQVKWGDVNVDGKVSIADAVLLNKAIAGNAKLTKQGEKNADVVHDGKIDKKDSKLLKQFIAEIVDEDALGK